MISGSQTVSLGQISTGQTNPEEPKDYDKLTAEQKKEIEPRITINYFKILQQEVKSQKQKIADLYGQVEDLTTKLNNLKTDLLKKGGTR